MEGPVVSPDPSVDRALRARAYRLLGDLYLEGPAPRLLPMLRELPGLGEHLPEPFDADEAAAEHHRLLGLEVFPWASVFLERDGALGGAVTESMGRAFARVGVDPAASAEAPDHLGRELHLLAALTERGDDAGAAELLDGHLLWWLPVFAHSAARRASPFWASALELTLAAVLDHVGAGDRRARVEPTPPGALALPVEDPLAAGDGGLRALARHLVTPARGGLFLSIGDIRALGREGDLPAGFGRREQVMTNLLRSAAAYDELGGVVDGLSRWIEAQRRFLDAAARPWAGPWNERLAGLRAALARVGAVASGAPDTVESDPNAGVER